MLSPEQHLRLSPEQHLRLNMPTAVSSVSSPKSTFPVPVRDAPAGLVVQTEVPGDLSDFSLRGPHAFVRVNPTRSTTCPQAQGHSGHLWVHLLQGPSSPACSPAIRSYPSREHSAPSTHKPGRAISLPPPNTEYNLKLLFLGRLGGSVV